LSYQDCSLIILNHDDVYSSEEGPGLLRHLQHLSDIEIRTAPLSTGLAADVHGQVSTYMIAFQLFLLLNSIQRDKLYKIGFGR
jgi:hypothetical protein